MTSARKQHPLFSILLMASLSVSCFGDSSARLETNPATLVSVQFLHCSILYFTIPDLHPPKDQLLWLRKVIAFVYAPDRIQIYQGQPLNSDELSSFLDSVHQAGTAPVAGLTSFTTPSAFEMKRWLAQPAFQAWAGPDLRRELHDLIDSRQSLSHEDNSDDEFLQALMQRTGVQKDTADFGCT